MVEELKNSNSAGLQTNNTTRTDDKCIDEFLNEKQLAKRLNLSHRTLQTWRQNGRQNLKFCKFGSRVLYSMSEILEYERCSRRRNTSDKGK